MDLFMAEVPPPYLGGTLASTATWNATGSPNVVTFSSDVNLSTANVQTGDLIRFSYRGELYYLTVSGNSASITPVDPTQSYPPAGAPLPFQIYRRPIKSVASAVQLTDGVAIDLSFSGIDIYTPVSRRGAAGTTTFASGTPFSNTYPSLPWGTAPTAPVGTLLPTSANDAGQIIITFAPTGALDLVYIVPNDSSNSSWTAQVHRPITGVFLLVGKIEKITTPASTLTAGTAQNPYPVNWLDPDCRWVAIGRQSGLVTTAEVAGPPATGITASPVTSARLATGSQNMVGN
jgi:hypothetical protein